MPEAPIRFRVTVKSVAVKEKVTKQDELITVEKVGTLTLSFNGDAVNAGALADFIGDEPIYIGLSDVQFELPGMPEEEKVNDD